jgi:hypothetical protein
MRPSVITWPALCVGIFLAIFTVTLEIHHHEEQHDPTECQICRLALTLSAITVPAEPQVESAHPSLSLAILPVVHGHPALAARHKRPRSPPPVC